MEKTHHTRKVLFSLFRKDVHLFMRALQTLWYRTTLSDPAKELRKKGMTRLEGFVDAHTCDKLQESLEELGSVYFPEKEGGEIPDINQLLPPIKAIPEEGLKSLLEMASGERVERFQNCARFRAPDEDPKPYGFGRLTPIVFTAYLLIRDTEENEAPISLIRGSHRFSFRPYFKLLKKSFSSSPNGLKESVPANASSVSGKKGDLIIINQNTLHKALPHTAEQSICHLEFEYMVISHLSYLHQAAREGLVRLSDKPYSSQAKWQAN